MLEHMSRRSRSLLSLTLTSLALTLSVLAFCTSYWCEGTHKVVKPLCLSPVKMKNCGSNNSQPFTTESPTPPPKSSSSSPPVSNRTVSPKTKEELAKIRQKQLANAVHYIWETGEDKYMLRYFHTGFWQSCEKHNEGVLWLSVVSEFMYISLLAMGFLLMWVEVLCACAHKEMYALKINAFAAICTVLSGMMGMVAHMMYTTVFQMTVSVGPKDWRPQTWDYGWSFAMAWISFSCCMAAAVLTLNSYTKTIIELRHKQRLRLEEARASHAPSYDEVVPGSGIYSVSGLMPCPDGLMDTVWARDGLGEAPSLVLVGGCGTEGCEDCERELEEMEDAMEREREREEGFSVSREEDGGMEEGQEERDAFC
ncbi:hypothetical protein MATL_G00230570 [Megalops atlanticus]|uniref:Germ cell-specific gene 1-like protein n=1 Tax=Megalops atlanticus TaxID=7932 RepID=A0A9D3PHX8_MEGAT|nr:hypothetical protein MATL_G00230570 [Megalops atlanticus]